MGTKVISDLKIVPLLLVIFAISMRLFPHPANVTPITALALFGSAYLPKRVGLVLPIIALLISDYFIGFYGTTMYFVYGSFLLAGLIGLYIRKHKTVVTVIGGSLLSSVLFFLITNFAVWFDPRSFYSADLSGLLLSYTAGLPFFRNSLAGDLFFSGLFFGGYELLKLLVEKYLPGLKHRLI